MFKNKTIIGVTYIIILPVPLIYILGLKSNVNPDNIVKMNNTYTIYGDISAFSIMFFEIRIHLQNLISSKLSIFAKNKQIA